MVVREAYPSGNRVPERTGLGEPQSLRRLVTSIIAR